MENTEYQTNYVQNLFATQIIRQVKDTFLQSNRYVEVEGCQEQKAPDEIEKK